jgi:hypothetical protein
VRGIARNGDQLDAVAVEHVDAVEQCGQRVFARGQHGRGAVRDMRQVRDQQRQMLLVA